jgi:MFS family permease
VDASRDDRYKWVALSNTTLAQLLATIDGTIVIVAMPEIFRGIHLDPLDPGNSFYLLWMILGFLVVTSVLVVSLGRLGDLFGRVRMYTLGFATYTVASLLLTVDWMSGPAGADWLIVFRVFQGIGAAFLIANSVAIITDAFPRRQRGFALGLNAVVGISGQFIGLILGGVLAPINWRLIFLVSVPFGLFGTVWSYIRLKEIGIRAPARIDWPGNATFTSGVVLIMIGVTYGIRPYGGRDMGWTSPFVDGCLLIGFALLGAFVVIETRAAHPMFRLPLFKIRAFTFGVVSNFLFAIARGGLMFMLIIWLQAIWLPSHGYSFAQAPLRAGIYMAPLTIGFLAAGPFAGVLSDRFGPRMFATFGMVGCAVSFVILALLPIDFRYPEFAAALVTMGVSMAAFAAPNRAGIMNSLPPANRGAGAGMNQTFQNSAQVFSIGIFFTFMILGLSAALPHSLAAGLQAKGVDAATASKLSALPPVSVLFAAFLGYNPVKAFITPQMLHHLTPTSLAAINAHAFFPNLIAGPFRSGLREGFAFAIGACLLAAVASWSRGARAAEEERRHEAVVALPIQPID